MKKISIGVLVLLVLIGGYFLSRPAEQAVVTDMQPEENTAEQVSSEEENQQTPEEPVVDRTVRNGEYIEYSEAALAEADGVRLLFFHAEWCPQCKALEEDINANGVASGVTVFEVDYDSNQELRRKYGITIQTTVVKVDENGEQIDKYNAYNTPSITAVEDNLL